MTREAKIGMLTGLGVIVLIGVLLSDYLGDARGTMLASVAGNAGNNTATGRMAPLPIGAGYRQQMMEPVGPGSMNGSNAVASTGDLTVPNMTPAQVIPPAFASQRQMVDLGTDSSVPVATGPTVSRPVAAVAVGRSPMESPSRGSGGLPTISVNEDTSGHEDALTAIGNALLGRTSKEEGNAAAGTSYVIAPGDNLGKIARKFYGSSKNSDVQRIVSANSSVLKDANSPLIAGRKIVIPGFAGAAGSGHSASTPGKVSAAMMKKTEPVMVYLPREVGTRNDSHGGQDAGAENPKGAATGAKKDAAKVYVVQSGDTLEKIARKLAPTKVSEMVEKLKSSNQIKDVRGLQVGTKLKLPA
jgi:LysM repeat protein